MYVRPISSRFSLGMLTPAMRAMVLSLSLLVARVRADDQHVPVPADHTALLTHGTDAGSDLHEVPPRGRGWARRAGARTPREPRSRVSPPARRSPASAA